RVESSEFNLTLTDELYLFSSLDLISAQWMGSFGKNLRENSTLFLATLILAL
ncbi:9531_t:CDS:1, partial [Dentiscutata erythropus]